MEIRLLKENERSAAMELVRRVFLEFEAPDYSVQGVEEFERSIQDPAFVNALQIYGAFADDRLLGVIAGRAQNSHIALFFVDGAHHRRGIGRRLFDVLLQGCAAKRITVNASPYAVPVYRRLGFVPTGGEQVTNGLRYTPMQYSITP